MTPALFTIAALLLLPCLGCRAQYALKRRVSVTAGDQYDTASWAFGWLAAGCALLGWWL